MEDFIFIFHDFISFFFKVYKVSRLSRVHCFQGFKVFKVFEVSKSSKSLPPITETKSLHDEEMIIDEVLDSSGNIEVEPIVTQNTIIDFENSNQQESTRILDLSNPPYSKRKPQPPKSKRPDLLWDAEKGLYYIINNAGRRLYRVPKKK